MVQNRGESGEGEQLDLIKEPIVLEEQERELGLEDLPNQQTLDEAEQEAPHETDLQTVERHLHPKFKDNRMNEVGQPIMASRVFPDNYLDLNYLLTMYMIEEQAEKSNDVDFLAIVTGNQVVTSIAYEGRGRADDLEVAGVAHEADMEKLSKELGLGE